jgi:hypothetical protein
MFTSSAARSSPGKAPCSYKDSHTDPVPPRILKIYAFTPVGSTVLTHAFDYTQRKAEQARQQGQGVVSLLAQVMIKFITQVR